MPDFVWDYFNYFNFLGNLYHIPMYSVSTKTKKEVFVLNSQHGTK